MTCYSNGTWFQDMECPMSVEECLPENPIIPFATPTSWTDNANEAYEYKRENGTIVTYECDLQPGYELTATCVNGAWVVMTLTNNHAKLVLILLYVGYKWHL